MDHVEGKVVVVTGAASGFGRLVSLKVAARGGMVAAADIDEEQLAVTVATIEAEGGRAIGITADVRSRRQMQSLAARAVQNFGRIDVLVNNAGIMPLAFYADHASAVDAWDRCIDINIKGVLNGITAVYDQMIRQGRGQIVNLSSIYGNFPVAGAGVYGATKAAVNFLSESLRVESQGRIKVTTVKPTGVPATRLGSGVVNPAAIVGILGANAESYASKFQAHAAGQLPREMTDVGRIEYFALDPDSLAEQILYAIDQPWGVSISEITVRASGDGYVL